MKLEESFEYCRNLTYQEAKNFYFSFLFLPKELKNAIYTIYAFCRIADDIADAENIELSEKKRQFKEFDELFDKCFQTEIIINDKMFTALQYVINKYKLSRKFLYDIVIGVRSDLEKTHYSAFQELYDYCYKVASSVAFVCIELFVPEKHRTKELFLYGEYLGIALQLTNILRDVSDDHQKNRRYIPLEWLNKFNITDVEFCEALEKNDFEKLKGLFEFIAATAQKYYDDTEKYINFEQKKYLFTLEIIKEIYLELLLKIRGNYDKILIKRISLNTIKKLLIALKIYIKTH